jgi:hypothetical protein
MPEPNRTPWLVAPGLGDLRVVRLIEQEAVLCLVCHACRRRVSWGAGELRRRFCGQPTLSLRMLAPRLRCGSCRSEWIEVGRGDADAAPAAATRSAE